MRGGTSARDVLDAFIAQRAEIDTVQQMFPGPEQDGRDRQVQLVDQGGAQILPNGGHAAAQPDVAAARRVPRLLQRGVNAVGDEPELRAALHRERRSRVMGQHEDGRVIRRLVAPPALPAVVRPRAADRAEHVPAENPRADSGEALRRDVVVVPVSPPSFPCIRCKVRVWKNQSNSSGPPTPSGFCRSWLGPAPNPSIEIEKLWTRSLDTAFFSSDGSELGVIQ